MITRIISAIFGLILLFIIMFSNVLVFNIAVTLISIVAVYEMLKAYGFLKNKLFIIVGIISSGVFCLLNNNNNYVLLYTVLMFIFFAVYLVLNHEKYNSKDIFTVITINLIIPFVFSSVINIRGFKNGEFLIWLLFISSWITDTFAYFTGRFLGKHKLCEKISPKKTIEGSVGGVIGAIIGFIVYAYITGKINGFTYNYFNLVILSLTSSILSQFGDLFASSVKREYKIKDFGNIMPGHGGVLDRFDSFILTAPYLYIFINLFEIII